MKEVHVWVYGRNNPVVFEDVEDFFETRKALAIVQEDIYKTTTTKIFKQAIIMYEVIDSL